MDKKIIELIQSRIKNSVKDYEVFALADLLEGSAEWDAADHAGLGREMYNLAADKTFDDPPLYCIVPVGKKASVQQYQRQPAARTVVLTADAVKDIDASLRDAVRLYDLAGIDVALSIGRRKN